MTLIGAFNCGGSSVVMFADGQETIQDYAKFNVDKFYVFEIIRTFRIVMTAAGDSDFINMIWQQVSALFKHRNDVPTKAQDIKALIVRTVARITKKHIFPYPRNDRPWVAAIWAVQMLDAPSLESVTIFRTQGLSVLNISKSFMTGSPVLLSRYLEDLYFKNIIFGVEEAEALAAYVLMEAKDYDPGVGKQSDIVILKPDGGIRWVAREDIRYWEEHFATFKNNLRMLPLLSCSSAVIKKVYPPKEYLNRFLKSFQFLMREQEMMRSKRRSREQTLEEKLADTLRKNMFRDTKREEKIERKHDTKL